MDRNQQLIPGELQQMKYWESKWGVSALELNKAILETGSIRVSDLRKYLLANWRYSTSNIITYFKLRFM